MSEGTFLLINFKKNRGEIIENPNNRNINDLCFLYDNDFRIISQKHQRIEASNLKINIQNDSIKYMEKNYTVNSEHYMSIVKFYGKRFMGFVLEVHETSKYSL